MPRRQCQKKNRCRFRCGLGVGDCGLLDRPHPQSAILDPQRRCGAGDGNRTHVAGLEGRHSTIELRPPVHCRLKNSDCRIQATASVVARQSAFCNLHSAFKRWWSGEDSNLRRLSHQIYSLTPLAAREPDHPFDYRSWIADRRFPAFRILQSSICRLVLVPAACEAVMSNACRAPEL